MPELPEVETMVRGLRPAFEGRRLRRLEVLDASLVQGCSALELARHGRCATVREVGRRGKWVVVTLAGHRGIIVIQPRMDWRLLAPRSLNDLTIFAWRSTCGQTACDGLVLQTRGGWARSAGTRAPKMPQRPFRSRTGPMPSRSAARTWRRSARAHGPRYQAGVDGPKSARRDRQYLCRRDLAPGPHPPRARRLHAFAGPARAIAFGDRPGPEDSNLLGGL